MTSLYRKLLGSDFERLPAVVRRFHEHEGKVCYTGKVITLEPSSLPAKLLAILLGTPRLRSEGPIRFDLDATSEREIWVRHFPARRMSSELRIENGLLVERLGAAKLFFRLAANEERLDMLPVSMRFLGIPCPCWLMPRIIAVETQRDGNFCFRIEAHAPLAGQVVGYQGELNLVEERSVT